MWTIRIGGMVLMTILTSFYFFPFEFSILPSINTKMAMAGGGLVLLALQLAKQRKPVIDRNIFLLSVWAGFVSLAGWFSVIYNNTPDLAYANYIISMWVWLSAAYVVTFGIRKVHGRLSVALIIRYLLLVCVAQCVLALLIDTYPALKHTVDSYIQQGQDFLSKNNVQRLYGIGASLDVAGSRFAAVLTLIAFSIAKAGNSKSWKWVSGYLMSFFIIGIIGNMIARTTTVGIVLALGYWLYASKVYRFQIDSTHKRLWAWGGLLLAIAIGVSVCLYNTNPNVEKKLRFAFEGFFSLAEEGKWNVSSNNRLKTMFVFPETEKTWIIGDGYFSNPKDIDPYFTGKEIDGFYMGTDIGYLRFVFYSGVIGLIAMCVFLYKAGYFCMQELPRYKGLFVLLLSVNYLVWLKVSTDIFLLFALFLMVKKDEEEGYG